MVDKSPNEFHISQKNSLSSLLIVKIKPISSNGQMEDTELDIEELEKNTLNLRDELYSLDSIEKIDLASKEGEKASKGIKGGPEVAELGSLLVTLGGSVGSTFHSNHC